MNNTIKDIATPNFFTRLKKAQNIPDKDVFLINQHSTATASINTKGKYANYMTEDKYYKTHIGKKTEKTNNIIHTTYTCGCMKFGRYQHSNGVACPGNTNTHPKFKTVCYHLLRTILEIHKDKKIILSDDNLALREFVKTLPHKPEYIKIVNRQNDNKAFWGVILK